MNDLKQLEAKLKGAVLKNKLIKITAGITGLVSILIGIWIILSLLAAIFIIPVPVKIVLMLISLGLIGFSIYHYLIKSLADDRGIIGAALELEKRHPEIKGRLVAALQFRNLNLDRTHFSPALIEMTGRQAMELTSGMDFNEIVSGHPLIKKLRSGSIPFVLAAAISLLIPGFFSNSFKQTFNPYLRVKIVSHTLSTNKL